MKKLLLALFLGLTFNVNANSLPICQLSDSDSDGDGYGWENGSSCLVVEIGANPLEENNCSYADADLYNGFGWDPIRQVSCPPLVSVPPSTTEETDLPAQAQGCDYSNAAINNGYGWNNETRTSCPPTTEPFPTQGETEVPEPQGPTEVVDHCDYSNASQHNNWGWDDVNKVSCPPRETDDGKLAFNSAAGFKNIKVLVSAGQSNSLGERTSYNSVIDSPVDNMIVWTSENGWQVANLCTQVWDRKWYPKAGGSCSNHPGFQIAKNMALMYPDNVIALIPTGKAGQPIVCWDDDRACFLEMEYSIETALDSLQFADKVDYMAFLQGESDSGRSQWINDLKNLISRIKSTNWFSDSGKFSASQTFAFNDINEQVKQLDNDGDPNTNWVSSSGLTTKDGTHWNASALRALGVRFMDSFLE